MCAGSFAWALGTLAATLERYEQAEGHFAAAAEIEERLGAPLLLARTHAGWARALIARGRPEDLDRAQHMLEQAEETAGRLGARGITREVGECRAALAAGQQLIMSFTFTTIPKGLRVWLRERAAEKPIPTGATESGGAQ